MKVTSFEKTYLFYPFLSFYGFFYFWILFTISTMEIEMKNIKIDEKVHTQLKVFCAAHGMKIGKLVEKLIAKHLKENNDA